MDILNNSDLTFSTDALTQLSNRSPVPAFHKNEQLKRERLPGYECGLEYSLIKKIKLNKGDDSQNDSKISQMYDHVEADDDSNRLIARKDSLKNTQRNRTLIRLEQSDPDTSNAIIRENNSKRSSFSSEEIADFNQRQYDLYADLQRSVADESYGLGDNSNLGNEYNVESEGLLINQPTDKNLIENIQMYSSGSMMSPTNFMGQIDAAYQESLQFYLKQKQTKFDQFMKKMEDILSLCTDTSMEAPLNYSEEQDNKPKTLKYIPNKQIAVNKKQKKNGKKRTY